MTVKSLLNRLARRPLITGAAILTLTGLLSRFIGFFYRIYLSRIYGEENMGIYQLINPVIALSFALTSAAFQTAVSKMTAEYAAKCSSLSDPANRRPFWASLCLSLPLSLLCTLLTHALAQPIGTLLLKEPRTVPLLRIIAFSFPFVGIHACINGWFYGMKKAGLPSIAQIIEQLTRVICVFLLTSSAMKKGEAPCVRTAVFGLALGELVSMTVAICTFLPYFRNPAKNRPQSSPAWSSVYRGLLVMVLPLTANRLVLNLLSSAESVAIPEMLRRYGYHSETALSVYGVLTGMALPLVFFPNALTSSIAVMLLPMISENECLGKRDVLRRLILRTLKCCVMVGMACLCVFVLFGPWLGEAMFHSILAGKCIRTLGWICPFLYLDTTLSAILQGFGKAGTLFFINVLCLLLRLAFVYLAIPHYGIIGYLWGMLASQLLLTALYVSSLWGSMRKQSADRP